MTDEAAHRPVTSGTDARHHHKRARHLYEIDIVRILTFVCVIGVHTTSHTAGPNDIGLYMLLDLLHFTREVFFALTAFVLVYTYDARPVPMRKFWPKRFLLVGVPYVVWSAIYVVAGYLHHPTGTLWDLVLKFVFSTLTGSAWYHLYFLLVTMQVYLLVPVILWLVRRTRGKHWLLMLVALVIQAGLMSWYHYAPATTGWYGDWAKQIVFTYSFFVIAGAVAADHAKAFLPWIRSHRVLIGWLVLGSGAIMIAFYWLEVAMGHSYYGAGTPMQPIVIVWSVAVGLGFLAIGTWWADRRRKESFMARTVDLASDRSFGIFLAHPMVIWVLLWVGDDWLEHTVPTPWLTLVTYVLVIIGAVLITEIARRTPLSLALTGRRYSPRAHHRKQIEVPPG
ncbi:acyltransferase [Humibacter sp. RRB41]|uniref:acyltransferase n=1 Tax=Humibacter sp. RRB41 TaxID=2919946 RepID=UPI001FAA27C5|nr:acyltransferase [Humibacter sp. RRB41]